MSSSRAADDEIGAENSLNAKLLLVAIRCSSSNSELDEEAQV